MDVGIHGKTALVRGVGGGPGRAIARALATEGARVAAADISAASLPPTLPPGQATRLWSTHFQSMV
jgi:3-oxoacyl-[acyl-carrier protein] reductase